MRQRQAAYSVIELLIVLALLAVLATVAMPLAETVRQRERERELQRALWSLRDAIDAYKKAADTLPPGDGRRTTSGYPPSLQALVDGLPDAQSPGGRKRFLRAVPRDPFAAEGVGAAQSWRLRSYAADTVQNQPGEDVYDVKSGSKALGLNGIPVAQW